MQRGEKTFHPATGKTRNIRLDESRVRELKASIEFGASCDVESTGNFKNQYPTFYCFFALREKQRNDARLRILMGLNRADTRWRSWVVHCATSRRVAGSSHWNFSLT